MRRIIYILTFLAVAGITAFLHLFGASVIGQTEHGGSNNDADAYVLSGTCSKCHTSHDSQGNATVATGGPLDYLAIYGAGTAACSGCHNNATGTPAEQPPYAGWGGTTVYNASAHGSASSKTNPDSQKDLPACASCHDVHGVEDPGNPGNPYAKLNYNKPPDNCFSCHDASGPAADDIQTLMTGTSSTSSNYSGAAQYFNGRHDVDSAAQATSLCTLACVNCHNPHRNKSTFTAGSSSKFIDPATYQAAGGDTMMTVAYDTNNYAGLGTHDPTTGTVPDYIVFCLTCHEPSATLPPGVAFEIDKGSPTITEIDWSSGGDQHGGADGSGAGKGYLRSQQVADPGYVAGYTGFDYTNDDLPYYPMNCTDCHDPHGTGNNMYLIKSNVNGEAVTWTDGTILVGKMCKGCHLGTGTHNSSYITDTGTCTRGAHAHSGGGF